MLETDPWDKTNNLVDFYLPVMQCFVWSLVLFLIEINLFPRTVKLLMCCCKRGNSSWAESSGESVEKIDSDVKDEEAKVKALA